MTGKSTNIIKDLTQLCLSYNLPVLSVDSTLCRENKYLFSPCVYFYSCRGAEVEAVESKQPGFKSLLCV